VAGILVVGVFVSHTVAAIIIMPLVATIGVQVHAESRARVSKGSSPVWGRAMLHYS
jgi:di/tricarboxylate transporter